MKPGASFISVVGAIALAGCENPAPAPAQSSSVAVTVETPHRGALPRWLTAYGTATPAMDGVVTLSVPQPGQATRLLTTAGAAVKAGQPLVVFTLASVARSAYQQASNALSSARRQQADTAQLFALNLATRDQRAQADRAAADAQAALDALTRDGAGSAIQTLVAPFDGVVTAVTVAQGDRTQPGGALLTVVQNNGLRVTAGIEAASQKIVHRGQVARLVKLTGGPMIAGQVVRVDSAINPRTRLIDVDIDYAPGTLLNGEAMRADINTGDVAGWVVPHKAVVTAGGSAHVFQVTNGKALAVPVSVALTGDTSDVVEGKIEANRPLIVDGAYQVQSGGAVRVAVH